MISETAPLSTYTYGIKIAHADKEGKTRAHTSATIFTQETLVATDSNTEFLKGRDGHRPFPRSASLD